MLRAPLFPVPAEGRTARSRLFFLPLLQLTIFILCFITVYIWCIPHLAVGLGNGGTNAHSWATRLMFDWCGHSLVPHHVETGRSLSDRCECVVTCLGLFFCCKDLTWFPHIYRVFGIGWSFRFCLVSIELWSPESWTIVIQLKFWVECRASVWNAIACGVTEIMSCNLMVCSV